jgi:hypothetical protein
VLGHAPELLQVRRQLALDIIHLRPGRGDILQRRKDSTRDPFCLFRPDTKVVTDPLQKALAAEQFWTFAGVSRTPPQQ